MGTTITFDTHAFVKQLKSAGFNDNQAEVQAQTINQALSDFQSNRLNELATKADLLTVKAELQTEITSTKAEIAASRSETIKWVAGMLVVQAGVVAALVKLL